MTFTEANTVEEMVLDALSGKNQPGRGLGWKYVAARELPRQLHEVLIEGQVRAAPIRLNPEIAEKPEWADEVIYRLRALPLAVQTDGLVRTNEAMTEWLRNE